MLAAQREPRHARLFLQIGNLCVKTTPTKVARPADRSCSCGGEPAAARRGRLGLQPLRRGEKRSTWHHLTHERQRQYRCSAHAERGSDTHREGGRGRERHGGLKKRRAQPLEEAVDLLIVWSADWYSLCAVVSIESPREA